MSADPFEEYPYNEIAAAAIELCERANRVGVMFVCHLARPEVNEDGNPRHMATLTGKLHSKGFYVYSAKMYQQIFFQLESVPTQGPKQ